MDIKHVARLANLPLTEEELAKFKPQLEKILDYVQQLQQVDTSQVAETSQVANLKNLTRTDEVKVCEQLVEGYIKTKAIFGND